MVTLIHGDTVRLLTEEINGRRVPAVLRHEGKILRADACITDPPYNVNLDGDRDWDDFQKDGLSKADEDFMQWTRDWARPLATEVLKEGSLIAAFSAHRTIHAVVFGLQGAGYDIIDMALWLYATGQVKHKQKLKPAYEPIAIARRRSPQGDSIEGLNKLFKAHGRGLLHTQDVKAEDGRHPLNILGAEAQVVEIDDDIRDLSKCFYVPKPSVKDRDYGCDDLPIRKKEGGLTGMQIKCEACGTVHTKMSADSCPKCGGGSLVSIGISAASGLARNIHPTVKPIALMRRLVRLLTRPGATVIDPFMGSGTTGIACVLEGRNFIGIEREAEFFEIATHRIAQAERDAAQQEAA
jgi:site-specific DNA-methyltransferase (adenine-specific)